MRVVAHVHRSAICQVVPSENHKGIYYLRIIDSNDSGTSAPVLELMTSKDVLVRVRDALSSYLANAE